MPDFRAGVRERLQNLGLDAATGEDVVLELTQHLEDRYRDRLARGEDEAAAVAHAWHELDGHPHLAAEIARARAGTPRPPVPDSSGSGTRALADDLRYAWRRLRHAPGFALVALATITLTVGANTAILSVADAVLFRPLPYADPDQVAIIQMLDRRRGTRFTRTDYQFLHAINAACPSVSEVAVIEPFSGEARPTLDLPGGRTPIAAMEATPNYFTLLGVRPARGRVFTEADTGSEGRVAVLSHAAWQEYFGGDAAIVGTAVTLGDLAFDIVGVLPAGFVFPTVFVGRPAIVIMRAPLRPGEIGGTFHAIARIAPGVSRERAQAEVDAATAPVSAEQPRAADTGPVLDEVRAVLYPLGRPVMRYLLVATLLLLLLGCANLANVMLVRGRRHLHDTAVRVALGASRGRLVRPLLCEAVILGLAGALLAVLLTSMAFEALIRQVPPVAYGRAEVGVGARVVVMAVSMGLLCGLAFSIVPAWRVSGLDALSLLQRREGGGRVRFGRPMVVAQSAIAVALVFGAVVAGRAFIGVLQTPLGFSPQDVLLIEMVPPPREPNRQAYYERMVRALADRADVVAASAAGSTPFSGRAPDEAVVAADGSRLPAGIVHALPGYFAVAGIPLRAGRVFALEDARADPDVAVVSESAARVLFGRSDPLGATVSNGRGREFRVVGVVGDITHALTSISSTPPPVYVIPGGSARALTVMARLRHRNADTLAAIAADLRPFAADSPPFIGWWTDRIAADHAYRDPRFQTIVLGSLAGLALGLTALGIASVVAYLVSARTREIGVRVAIGAAPGSLVRLIVGQSLLPVVAGVAAGLALAQVLRRFIEAQLASVDTPAAIETQDPALLLAAAGTVAAAALAAAYLPARRAARIDPTNALRAE